MYRLIVNRPLPALAFAGRRFLLALLAATLLCACGQRGDLTLPEPKPDDSEEQAAR